MSASQIGAARHVCIELEAGLDAMSHSSGSAAAWVNRPEVQALRQALREVRLTSQPARPSRPNRSKCSTKDHYPPAPGAA